MIHTLLQTKFGFLRLAACVNTRQISWSHFNQNSSFGFVDTVD